MTEVQEDIQQAGEDIKGEFSGAERDVRGVEQDVPGPSKVPALNTPARARTAPSPAAASQAPPPQAPPPARGFPDPADAVYAAIVDTFSTGNGELAASPQPSPPLLAARRNPAFWISAAIGSRFSRLRDPAKRIGKKNLRQPAARVFTAERPIRSDSQGRRPKPATKLWPRRGPLLSIRRRSIRVSWRISTARVPPGWRSRGRRSGRLSWRPAPSR